MNATERTVFGLGDSEFSTAEEALKTARPGDRIMRLEQTREGRKWVTRDRIIHIVVTIRDLMPYLLPEEACVLHAIRQFPRGHAGRTREVASYCVDPAALRNITQYSSEAAMVDAVRKAVRGGAN